MSEKVFVLTNVPVPYRVDFFNELGKRCELSVLFEQLPQEQSHRSAEWFDKQNTCFRAMYLRTKEKKRWKAKELFKILDQHKNDRIIIMGYSLFAEMIAITWARLRRIPFFFACDGGFVKDDSLIKRKLKKWLVSGAAMYLSTGAATDKYLMTYGAKKERIYRVPFSTLFKKDIADRPMFLDEKHEIRNKLSIKEKKVVVSVGQFIPRKGYDVLLKACIGLSSEVGVYIIGSVPTEEYIRFKEENRLENVYFVGFKKKEELKNYYRAADLFVLPTREDIWGLVVNEAMANGLPVITTDKCIAGLELIRNGENGDIVHVEDVDELRDAMIRIIEDRDTFEMGKMSIEIVSKQTIEEMVDAYLSVLEQFNR